MTTDPTLQVFFDEACGLLETFEAGTLGLERAPDEPELLHSIFRAAHTIKGNSGTFGFERVAGFTHTLEELLSRLRSGAIRVTPEIVTTLLAAGDCVRALLGEVRDGEERVIEGLADVPAALTAHARAEAAPADPAPAAAARPATPPAPPVPGSRVLYEIAFDPPGPSSSGGSTRCACSRRSGRWARWSGSRRARSPCLRSRTWSPSAATWRSRAGS